MAIAFVVACALGLLVEWLHDPASLFAPARHAARDLGLSLIMQQAFRSTFGAREVGVDIARVDDGLAPPSPDHRMPINGLFVMGLTLSDHRDRRAAALQVALGPAGARHDAEPHHERRGRHRHRASTAHLRARLRHRRHRRRGLHHDRLDRADQRASSTSSIPSWWSSSAARRACSAPSPRRSPSRRRSRRWSSS